ncbi:unnamed protein product [Prorocentrum cordatum]|uniref:Uncharacterized protein n=1 Tax=Prorocentrum cordatum TaxID=2364126 RepID=A0ABN9T6H6_9DINO|nr:unnamed protein product [Polarella glacialis]
MIGGRKNIPIVGDAFLSSPRLDSPRNPGQDAPGERSAECWPARDCDPMVDPGQLRRSCSTSPGGRRWSPEEVFLGQPPTLGQATGGAAVASGLVCLLRAPAGRRRASAPAERCPASASPEDAALPCQVGRRSYDVE